MANGLNFGSLSIQSLPIFPAMVIMVHQLQHKFLFLLPSAHPPLSLSQLHHIDAYPGQRIVLNLVGLDQFKNPTYFVARLLDSVSTLEVKNLSTIFEDNSKLIQMVIITHYVLAKPINNFNYSLITLTLALISHKRC